MSRRFFTAVTLLVTCAGVSWSGAAEPWDSTLAATALVSPPGAADSPSPLLPQYAPAAWAEDNHARFCATRYAPASGPWVRAEFLMWAIKQGQSPPLVQSEGPGGEMTTLFGGNLDHDLRLGGRFTIGTWLDDCQMHGIEGNYFFLDGQANDFSGFASGLPGGALLSRPFFDSATGTLLQQDIFIPGAASGTIDISSRSRLQGAEANVLSNLCNSRPAYSACDSCDTFSACDSICSPCSGHRWDLISGFRYLNFEEDLFISENLAVFPNAPLFLDPGSTIALSDNFRTRNNFYGGQLGLRGRWWRDRWFVDVMGKVALGTTHQQVRIDGSTVFTDSGGVAESQQGGLLALTNIGSFSRNRFTTIPEVGINIGRQVTDRFRASVGYNFMYWSNVVRPGDQFDATVDQTQLPVAGGPAPVQQPFAFHSSDFWAQGISFGLEFAR